MARPIEPLSGVEQRASKSTDGESGWRLGHQPALDGLRGLALLAVLAGHAGVAALPNAHNLGVEVFFVLSGFLITSLLVEEHLDDGRIALGPFYLRRVRRLAPALLVFVGAVVTVSLVLGLFTRTEVLAGAEWSLLYVANFARGRAIALGPFEHLWSLSVEEHFYLIWPAVFSAVLAVGRRRRLELALAVVVIGAVASSLARFALADNWRHTVNWTQCRASGLLVGCGLAILLHGDSTRLRAVGRRVLTIAGIAALAVIVALSSSLLVFIRSDLYSLPIVDIATATLIAGLVLAAGPLTKAFAWRPLQRTGRLSYAAYLWHYPVFILVGGTIATLTLPEAALGLLITAGLAELSMRFVEAPFLARHRSQQRSGPADIQRVA